MWKGHPACYVDKLEDLINTSEDSDLGNFVEADKNHSDKKKKKRKKFRFALEKKK